MQKVIDRQKLSCPRCGAAGALAQTATNVDALLFRFFDFLPMPQLLSIAAIPLSPISRQTVAWRGLLVPVAVLGGLSLAAVQLLPTAELIFQGDSRGRGVEFLESFSSPPWHLLVQQLAPGLLQGHPLWEPICWIPAATAWSVS